MQTNGQAHGPAPTTPDRYNTCKPISGQYRTYNITLRWSFGLFFYSFYKYLAPLVPRLQIPMVFYVLPQRGKMSIEFTNMKISSSGAI